MLWLMGVYLLESVHREKMFRHVNCPTEPYPVVFPCILPHYALHNKSEETIHSFPPYTAQLTHSRVQILSFPPFTECTVGMAQLHSGFLFCFCGLKTSLQRITIKAGFYHRNVIHYLLISSSREGSKAINLPHQIESFKMLLLLFFLLSPIQLYSVCFFRLRSKGTL